MKYEPPKNVDRKELHQALVRKDSRAVCESIIGLAFYDDDWKWVQDTCLSLLGDEDASIRQCAATSLGHIARIHGVIEKGLVIHQLENLKEDSEIKDAALNALDDIYMFTK